MLSYVTRNSGKFQEAATIIPDLKQVTIDLPEIQESDPHKIIDEKIRIASDLVNDDFIVEDVSLALEGLGGLPGPMIKWFEKSLGLNGICNLVDKLGNDRAVMLPRQSRGLQLQR